MGDVVEDVADVFEADGQADRCFRHAHFGSPFDPEFAVGCCGRVGGKSFRVTKVVGNVHNG